MTILANNIAVEYFGTFAQIKDETYTYKALYISYGNSVGIAESIGMEEGMETCYFVLPRQTQDSILLSSMGAIKSLVKSFQGNALASH